ncbi:hypothetical protein SAMD00019534_063030 [Acytostelium subglobosum LB1]|uniref:hypothetical protein n=1 Tax=Acytostelium subglobosum LB1 TaxID=1410327 RepID=UPI0006450898|nr:hypothetical protein SAMD00019534_063030 [Acytostelium subglobosum LB1]GAM23128.1 hypothetical protein SAMD00019534_063030 [Acytostelium subglobosum LB1]|eukprot:XP_012753577.1 hypothetical protein SAMD00019534_063030 [Acytostelium subglobosum LB1]
MSSKSDPRRPPTATFDLRPQLTQTEKEAANLDYYALLCFMFAFIGIIAKYKIALWISVVCCVASLANMKSAESGVRAVTSTVSLCLMGLAMAYFGPNAPYFV